MKRTILLSDAHLDVFPESRPRLDTLVRFLRAMDPAKTERLVVLGDLFDFWFEYHQVIFSGYFDVLRAFADLRDGGVALHFVCGNHDFWAGRFLENELGFTIHRAPALMDFGGRTALLAHGDGLNPADWPYRVYKRVARARTVVWFFGLLHPDWAMGIARAVSRTSRARTRRDDPSESSETRALRAFARSSLEKRDADVVICGHCHHPERMDFANDGARGLYLNTGDWITHRSYVEWDGEDFRLNYFAS